MYRVREVIEHLNYHVLVDDKVIPDLLPYLSHYPEAGVTKRYPPFVYAKRNFSFFGMWWDYFLRGALRILIPQPVDLGIEPATVEESVLNIYQTSTNFFAVGEAALSLVSAMYGSEVYSLQDIKKYLPTAINIAKDITAIWQQYRGYLVGTIRYNEEYRLDPIEGHPDVATDEAILEIKTMSKFATAGESSFLQLLSYYALRKTFDRDIKYIGFLLPLQRSLTLINVAHWDTSLFLQILLSGITKPKQSGFDVAVNRSTMSDLGVNTAECLLNAFTLLNLVPVTTVFPYTKYGIGSHTSKENTMVESFKNFVNRSGFGAPCQLYIANPKSGNLSATMYNPKDVEVGLQYVTTNNLRWFSHAPLCLNTCSGEDYVNTIVKENLQVTAMYGGRGVVMHTGQQGTRDRDVAVNNMEKIVRALLPYASESCPLLLETPCNEGTEICAFVNELASFFARFTSEEHKLLGLCVDTCHVFAAGYAPMDYISRWVQVSPVAIRLVHFNDSETACGSCTDRHAPAGRGYIGLRMLEEVAKFCTQRNIPMVTE
jgi:deoxyribonuclease-4